MRACLSYALRYPKEHYFALRLPGFAHYPDNGSIEMMMGMDYWWNDTDRGKTEALGDKLCYYNSAHHKFRKDWSGIEPISSW